jgi:hypothetical protein
MVEGDVRRRQGVREVNDVLRRVAIALAEVDADILVSIGLWLLIDWKDLMSKTRVTGQEGVEVYECDRF